MNAPLPLSANAAPAATFAPADRIRSIGVSDIVRISQAANELKRQGQPVIVLGLGEPDFDTPAHVLEAAQQAMAQGDTHYTALDGTPALKAAIQLKFRRDNALEFATNEITVGAGAKQVIYNALMASLNPGDEVILPAPYWTSYADMVLIAGGVPVVVPCSEANGFRITAQQLEAAITPRTRWVFINSPSTPVARPTAPSSCGPFWTWRCATRRCGCWPTTFTSTSCTTAGPLPRPWPCCPRCASARSR